LSSLLVEQALARQQYDAQTDGPARERPERRPSEPGETARAGVLTDEEFATAEAKILGV
jgi:hypothetical protein